MKLFFKLLAVLLVAFAGGVLAFAFVCWLKPISTPATGDAVSIANTYIVFTTIIFVGFTVVLGVAGYVFTQQFSTSKETHENRILDELKNRLKESDTLSKDLIQIIMDNESVKAHVTETLESKVNQVVNDKLTEKEFSESSGSLSDIDGGDASGQ